jgi:enamine deaminase RidA (YjgF/YER057c/UK114 family)
LEQARFVYNNRRAPVDGRAKDNTMSIERRHVGKRLSGLVINRASGTAYLAGQVADDASADITGQTQQVLAQIDGLLFEAGSDKTKILSATIYLPDMADFAAMNAVWEKWVPEGQTPARATVQAKLARSDYRVEIQVVAAVPIPA